MIFITNYRILLGFFFIIFSCNKNPTKIAWESKASNAKNILVDTIIDSNLSLDQALTGLNKAPDDLISKLVIIDVNYYGYDDKLHKGQLVCHNKVAKDLNEIFNIIEESRFHINSVIPISKFNWDDYESMEYNNTSCFNYRHVSNSNKLSQHAYGLAIDINPCQNPHIKKSNISPKNAVYNPKNMGTILAEDFIVKEFAQRGWKWGGHWQYSKDYQHFYKNFSQK
ncbi:MAG: M15 family metallopeptidase [Flavobacteriaceae bacterium]